MYYSDLNWIQEVNAMKNKKQTDNLYGDGDYRDCLNEGSNCSDGAKDCSTGRKNSAKNCGRNSAKSCGRNSAKSCMDGTENQCR